MLESATEESDAHASEDEQAKEGPEVSLSTLSQHKKVAEPTVDSVDPQMLAVQEAAVKSANST